MSTEQAGSVVIQVTAADFERLSRRSGKWPGSDVQGRFETLDDVSCTTPPRIPATSSSPTTRRSSGH